MSLRENIEDFKKFAEEKGKTTINKDDSKSIELSLNDMFNFGISKAVKSLNGMSKEDIKKLKNQKQPILKIEKPKL